MVSLCYRKTLIWDESFGEGFYEGRINFDWKNGEN